MRFSQSCLAMALAAVSFTVPKARAAPLTTNAGALLDPSVQELFSNLFTTEVPNALADTYQYSNDTEITVEVKPGMHDAKLVDGSGNPLMTPIWGYAEQGGDAVWPGFTFVAQKDVPRKVIWENKLPISPGGPGHLITGTGIYDGIDVLDETLHWTYSLPGYTGFTTEQDGVPVVAHLHGGHSEFASDGNPEFFFSPDFEIRGPQWRQVRYTYANDQPAGNLWYHDHALGHTRLNVYAGMAGLYFLRDDQDTGEHDNPLGLPAGDYEVALAIQDRMFKPTGEFFYPAFPGDPFYEDFITGEGAILPPGLFPDGGPTALAEFFGDFMLVNGKAWPKLEVEPRKYRLRFVNGCDSRFLALQFIQAATLDSTDATGPLLEFTVIGSDQSLGVSKPMSTLLFEPGSRYDIIFDFSTVDLSMGKRIIMKNTGGDSPFGGDLPGERPTDGTYLLTDRIMAFDVVKTLSGIPDRDLMLGNVNNYPDGDLAGTPDNTRKVALFEGTDEFGRLQPLLGTIGPSYEPFTDPPNTVTIDWPTTPVYVDAGLTGQMEGTIAWHSPTTEKIELGHMEEWEIWNLSGDAHPIHLHLVHFEVVSRRAINFDNNTDAGILPENSTEADLAGDGVWLMPQLTVQHNSAQTGKYGSGFKAVWPDSVNPIVPGDIPQEPEYYEESNKDMVTALPGQVTTIRALFDKPGRYVWHCHILSHEDHEMMRVMEVVEEPGAGEEGGECVVDSLTLWNADLDLEWTYNYDGSHDICKDDFAWSIEAVVTDPSKCRKVRFDLRGPDNFKYRNGEQTSPYLLWENDERDVFPPPFDDIPVGEYTLNVRGIDRSRGKTNTRIKFNVEDCQTTQM